MFQTETLYQNDPEWQTIPLGNQNKETIGSWGCLLTSMTMVLNSAGYDETPASLNEKMKQNRGFQGALVIPSVLPLLFPNLSFCGFESCESRPAPLNKIDAALSVGKPVIVQVECKFSESIQTHWVLLKDKKGNDYVIYDPRRYEGDSPEKEILLTSRYKYQGTDPAQAISGIVWFDIVGVAAKLPERSKVSVPAERYIVYVAEDNLALRTIPSYTGHPIRLMVAGAELISLEPKSVAAAKIGQNDQWLNVQDLDGEQGYTAAWYLSKTKDPDSAALVAPTKAQSTTTPEKVQPLSATTDELFLLTPTIESLVFQTNPVIDPAYQIRHISSAELLAVVEPVAQAADKIGNQGQWIKVRDVSGQVGYVAAWNVKSILIPNSIVNKVAKRRSVFTIEENVALRSNPFVSDEDENLIKRLDLGAELFVAESGGESKIGQTNQWLKVKEPKGEEGYIAAWYISTNPLDGVDYGN